MLKKKNRWDLCMERERFNYKLPATCRGQDVFLPDYITVDWYSPVINDLCSMQVSPDKLEEFMQNQEKIEGEGVIWIDQNSVLHQKQ
jgi:hypothetical protein